MPDFIAPGVHVEETSSRPKPIEGVTTSTTGFVGPTRFGPVGAHPPLLASLADFERIYGDGQPLIFGGVAVTNFMWHAARAFFAEGGKRLYVARVARKAAGKVPKVPKGGASGNDGAAPTAADYSGTAASKTGLRVFEDLADISIVAAPGATYNYATNTAVADGVSAALIAHAEKMRYRIAVLDSGNGLSVAEVRAQRSKFDSGYAAFFYPWITVRDPATGGNLNLPPSGFVAGIYARSDLEHGVAHAPANETVKLATGFERLLSRADQELLNPEGINCFRFFEGRGFLLWGARTISSDPEWKYVNVRRYFAYLEHSIEQGTQWVVFEPNGDPLWASVRSTVADFLYNEWKSGALLGDKPESAFFVRCDRSTMTQADLDQGRLVCLIGVALLRPAEFVIFRIGQWTADHKP